MKAEIKAISREEIHARQEDMRRRLDGRCQGLLEVTRSSASDPDPFFRYKVDFPHRTVRDFLLTKNMQTMLADRIQSSFNPRLSLCNAFLAQMKALQYRRGRQGQDAMEDIFEDLVYYAREVEVHDGIAQVKLVDEAERVLIHHPILWTHRKHRNSFLDYVWGLQLYVTEKLTHQPESIHTEDDRPILDYVLNPMNPKRPMKSTYKRVISEQVVKLIFRCGADPNQAWSGSTVWGRFISSLNKGNVPVKDAVFQVVDSLVRQGADLDYPVESKTAREVIIRTFTPAQADCLLERAQARG